jgi:hypothetical protein
MSDDRHDDVGIEFQIAPHTLVPQLPVLTA